MKYGGKSLIVFSPDGIVPYRFSRYGKGSNILLFMSQNGHYDRIEVDSDHDMSSDLNDIRHIVEADRDNGSRLLEWYEERRVDYTLKALKLVSYATNMARSLDLSVSYKLVEEHELEDLVERVYENEIYYEGIVKSSGCEYSDEYTVQRKQTCRIRYSKGLLVRTLHPLVADVGKSDILIISPVDMTKYHTWNILREDILYSSASCYSLNKREEVQYLRTHGRD